MIWPFKKGSPIATPSRFPNGSNNIDWMREQVAYYRKAFPKQAWVLFSPYTGSYLPIFIACGSGWKDDDSTLLEYRQIKRENPDLVALAIKNRPEHYAYVISRVGDGQDYDYNIRLYS